MDLMFSELNASELVGCVQGQRNAPWNITVGYASLHPPTCFATEQNVIRQEFQPATTRRGMADAPITAYRIGQSKCQSPPKHRGMPIGYYVAACGQCLRS